MFILFLNGSQLIIEAEYLTFVMCPKYVNVREIYLYNWYFSKNELFDFIHLIKSWIYKTLKQLTLFVTKLMQEIEMCEILVSEKGHCIFYQ